MDFVRGSKKWIGLAATVLIAGYIFHNITTSHTIRYTCHGRYTSDLNGSKEIKNDAIFGIRMEKYDTFIGKGAYIHTILMRDLSDQGMGSTSTRYYNVEEGKDNPSLSDAGVDMTVVTEWTNKTQNEGVYILISDLTQTLHFVERGDGGNWIQSFDGNCRKLN